jgi:polar amino acid transport system substrate-binding protein
VPRRFPRAGRILAAAALAAGGLTAARAQTPPPMSELAPEGTLRVGIGVGPASSAFWATTDPATGEARGVTVELATELARRLNVPLELVRYPNSGEVSLAGQRGEWDVTFLPVDADRATIVDFGPPYYVFEGTYLVRPGSAIQTLADVDREGVRVAGVENTTTARAADRSLTRTRLTAFKQVEPIIALLTSGDVDALAMSRESLRSLLPQLPGARILDGAFHTAGVAVAVPKNRPAALAYVTAFIEDAKRTGVVRRAFDRAGLADAAVAPPAER